MGGYEEPVQLTEGTYTGDPFVEGGASRLGVVFADRYVADGELNGDGAEDAAAILAETSGGRFQLRSRHHLGSQS